MNKEYEIKLISCQKLCLKLDPGLCEDHFIHEWGLPVFSQFSLESFLDVLTLVLLEEKVVFVCENKFLLSFTVHLFTRLLPRPFKYPYPAVSLLPDKEEYLNTPFPVVYGFLSSKKNFLSRNLHQDYRNVYIFLGRGSVQIMSAEPKKHVLKKRPKTLSESLSKKFRNFGESNRRVSNVMFTGDEPECGKDKEGICKEIVKTVNDYLSKEVL